VVAKNPHVGGAVGQVGGTVAGFGKHAGGVASELDKHPGHILSTGYHQDGRYTAQNVHHMGGEAGKLGHHLGGVASAGAHHSPEVMAQLAKHPGHILSEGVKELPHDVTTDLQQGGLDTLQTRFLRPEEKSRADQVFRGTVPLDRVLISPLIGRQGRPFTIPGSMFMAVSLVAGYATGGYAWIALGSELMADIGSKYIIFLGAQGYRDALHCPWDGVEGETLIHELTHVWQGCHSEVQWAYVFGSLGCQISQGRNAYSFILKDDDKPGSRPGSLQTAKGKNPTWSSWGVEQQAMIVEGWFSGFIGSDGVSGDLVTSTYGRQDERSPAFAYIKNNIRTGNPNYDNYRYGTSS
jgi:hypothetical protein